MSDSFSGIQFSVLNLNSSHDRRLFAFEIIDFCLQLIGEGAMHLRKVAIFPHYSQISVKSAGFQRSNYKVLIITI